MLINTLLSDIPPPLKIILPDKNLGEFLIGSVQTKNSIQARTICLKIVSSILIKNLTKRDKIPKRQRGTTSGYERQ
jgi:hypothetical protein